jgi:hypothetical protein
MAERVISVLAGLLPVLIVIPLFTNLLGGFLGFIRPQTRSVSKSDVRNTTRVELQKTFSSTMRNYAHVFVRFKNNTGSTKTYYVKVGAFLDNQHDEIPDSKIIHADKVTLTDGEVKAFTVVSPATDPQTPDPFLNKWKTTNKKCIKNRH